MIRFHSIHAETLAIPFKVAFKHASAERDAMQSLWVEIQGANDVRGVGEGCPREYVTNESLETALAFVDRHRAEWLDSIGDVDSLRAWVAANRLAIDANPAAWCAVELACLDGLGQASGRTIEQLAGLPAPSGRYRYSAVIGDGPDAAFAAQLGKYLDAGFIDFKIKLSGDLERDLAKVRMLCSAGIVPGRARADANNLWRDPQTAIAYLRSLAFPFFAIEEPLAAGDHEGLREVAHALDACIILDESATREDQLGAFARDPELWIVNLRVSKMGGLLRSLDVAGHAKALGLQLIVGAHVGETSVLTRAALTVADSARDILVAQEGAFGTHLLERDPVAPSLRFGPGGILDLSLYPPLGAGLGV